MLLIDLCCGLGGVSAAARARGWKVVGLDIAACVNPSVRGDLRALPFRSGLAPDMVWISPCCKQYTLSRLPWSKHVVPDTEMMRAAVLAIEYLKPRSWVIENVPAAVPWVADFMGRPTAKIWGHVFWSNLWPLLAQVRPHKERIPGNCKFAHYRRSLIPFEVAHSFVAAAELR